MIPQEEVLSQTERDAGRFKLVRDETYTFTPNDGSPEIHIRSGQLVRMLHEHALQKVIDLTFPAESLESIVARNGVNVARADALTEEAASVPVVVGLWHDGAGVLMDGAHRRYYWAKRGINVLRGWAVPYALWSTFIFDPAQVAGIVHERD